jgi:hypothetical protein
MRRALARAIVSLALVLLSIEATAEQWDHTFGGPKSDYGFCVEPTPDGGYIIAGRMYSVGAGESDAVLIKTDDAGEMQWYQVFGGEKADYALSVRQTADGGYVFAGKTYSFGEGSCDVWLVKTDSLGNEEWSRTFGGPLADAGNSVWQTADGGYIIVGKTYSSKVTECDLWLIKTDELGNLEWDRTFGGPKEDSGRSVQQTDDSGYIIAGYKGVFGRGNWDSWLIKTDSSGALEWQLTPGIIGADGNFSVQQTADGAYIAAGCLYSRSKNYDVYVVKVGPAGAAHWKKTFGGEAPDFGMSVDRTADGGYIVAGYTYSYGEGQSDVWLIKLDSEGNRVWDRTFGGAANDMGRSVREIAPDEYIIAGHTASFGAGERDVWLIKAASPEPGSIENARMVDTNSPTDVRKE